MRTLFIVVICLAVLAGSYIGGSMMYERGEAEQNCLRQGGYPILVDGVVECR